MSTSHSARLSLPPETATRTVLLRREHVLLLDGALHLALEEHDEAAAAEGGVVMAELNLGLATTAFALHGYAPPPASAAGDDVADFDRVVGFDELLIGDQFVPANHHDRSGQQAQVPQNVRNSTAAVEIDLLVLWQKRDPHCERLTIGNALWWSQRARGGLRRCRALRCARGHASRSKVHPVRQPRTSSRLVRIRCVRPQIV